MSQRLQQQAQQRQYKPCEKHQQYPAKKPADTAKPQQSGKNQSTQEKTGRKRF